MASKAGVPQRLLVGGVTTIVIAACAGALTPSIPDQGSQDGQHFVSACGGPCHAVPHPKRHTFDQWQHLVTVMDDHRHNRGIPPLTDDERAAVLRYLQQYAR